MEKPITVAIAGTTAHTRQCAAALAADPRFQLTLILTPEPKRIGRQQLLTPNPLHQFAQEQQLPVQLVGARIDQSIKTSLFATARPDILLVVDFGYFVPKWLLDWPKLGPLNIHPSRLPRWRGSSPGQFCLLYGDNESTVTLMIMTEALDAGPILALLPFAVESAWTSADYYRHSFDLITNQLPDLLYQFASGQLRPTPQPEDSPTPTATRFSRDDGYVSWQLFKQLQTGKQPVDRCEYGQISPLLLDAFAYLNNIYDVIEHAIRAFAPWPGIWTLVPTEHGEKRLKIHSAHLTSTGDKGQLVLDLVQLEGKTAADWRQIAPTITTLD